MAPEGFPFFLFSYLEDFPPRSIPHRLPIIKFSPTNIHFFNEIPVDSLPKVVIGRTTWLWLSFSRKSLGFESLVRLTILPNTSLLANYWLNHLFGHLNTFKVISLPLHLLRWTCLYEFLTTSKFGGFPYWHKCVTNIFTSLSYPHNLAYSLTTPFVCIVKRDTIIILFYLPRETIRDSPFFYPNGFLAYHPDRLHKLP